MPAVRKPMGATVAMHWIRAQAPDLAGEDLAIAAIGLALKSPVDSSTLAVCRHKYVETARILPSFVEAVGK